MQIMTEISRKILQSIEKPTSIAPLAMFRVLFGFMMMVSIIRFILKGWVYELYIKPQFFFTYYGFEWVKPLGEIGMYALYISIALSAFFIMVGYKYRIFSVLFFFTFTYSELIDKTNYLNHYYFISLIAFVMMFLPAHRYFSVDAFLNPKIKTSLTPNWTVQIIKAQLAMVYIFAGIAKINYDWLIRAMPLKLWLPANAHLPVIGNFLDQEWMAYTMSWTGCIYDLFIVFFLLYSPTRIFAYGAVIIFHLLTAWFFPIGMFPFIMIVSTLIFFSAEFHQKIINTISSLFKHDEKAFENSSFTYKHQKTVLNLFALFFALQLVLCFRYVLYPGKLFWTEEGFRFSWRVMLIEKAGLTFFYVKNPQTGHQMEVRNRDYLTPNQEKMMSTQADMILQFAHFLKKEFEKQGIENPEIYAKSYVTLNNSGSRPFINSFVDLTKEKESFKHKHWILNFEN